VITTLRFLIGVLTAVGALVAGLCGDLFGVRAALFGIGIACLMLSLLLLSRLPVVRIR
jgi:hypothetical protein